MTEKSSLAVMDAPELSTETSSISIKKRGRRVRVQAGKATDLSKSFDTLCNVEKRFGDLHKHIDAVRVGVTSKVAFDLQEALGADPENLEKIVGVSYRTIQRHDKEGTLLSSVATDRIARSVRVIKQICDTLGGGKEVAKAWLHRPCKPLGGSSPIELMDTDAGLNEIEDVLGRIRHGVFS